jgi:4-hydroxy-2-oxoglutarate aldolase
MSPTQKPTTPPSGVWAPALTFFDHTTDTLDLAAQKKYFAYLSRHLTGLVILGTNAETFLLTREERSALLRCAREAVGPDYPLMAGVGGHSTKQVLEYISDAAEAGIDYVLVLPCAYFGKATTAKVVGKFYDAVAETSTLPVVLYNFPGVTNGVDLDSDVIAGLAARHPGKITGVKLTCASVGKITRLAAQVKQEDFAVYGGQADFLIAGLSVGSAGCIAAFANVFPKVVMRIYELWQKGEAKEALELHQKAALAERACKAGIASTKYAAALTSAKAAGIEGAVEKLGPRAPYEPVGEAERESIRGLIGELSKVEESL